MRSWLLCISAGVLAGVANAACTNKCGSNKCLGAIAADPAFGESFCSSFLALEPVTTTVTEIETVTTELVNVETALTTITVTTATFTVTGSEASTIFQKRAPTITEVDPALPDPTDAIFSKCSTSDDRISKACSCLLSTATTSTVTVFETATSTATVEAESTIVETVTDNVVATVSVAAPAVTIPPNIIINGNFENYLQTGNILPWTDTTASNGGRLDIVNGVNPCSSENGVVTCAGGQVVIRPYPPTTGSKYVGIRESFVGRPSTTYAVSFVYRCLNFDAATNIQVLYNGAVIGTANQCINSAAFSIARNIRFTTDATGQGEIEIRFRNSGATPYLYFYADAFQAIAV
ncbi:hypothetical protein QBC40DRAFT_347508 [Triangularia verruculosa]|uniref:Uncharacterized protein n=1 Tax=Triangularia verruculosa TaxID=2587418 RepID=A0AAN6XKD9_9PEZI|nr:hypothetical protein QBC40DRAFT_347508 [Triangularia verruculosa]